MGGVTRQAIGNPHARARHELVIILGTRILLLVTGVLHQGMLAHLLLPAGRGAYAVCVLLGVLLGILVTPGAGSGAQYFVMAGRLSLSEGVSIALTISMVGSGLGIAAALPLIHGGQALFARADPQSFSLALLLVPLTSFSGALALQLGGLRRFGRLAVFSLLQALVAVLAVALFGYRAGLGVAGAILALAAGNLVMIVAALVDLRRHCGLVWEVPTRAGLMSILGYGLRQHGSRVGAAVEDRLGGLLLSFTATPADIGLFSAGSALLTRVLFLPYSISVALQPRVAADRTGRPQLTAFCARVSWWATGVVLAVLLAVSAPLVRLLLSEEFLPVIPLLWIMAGGILVYSGADLFMAYFRGTNRPGVCSWAIAAGVVAHVAAFLALYPALGVASAAWGMTVGLIVRSVVLLAAWRRIAGIGLRSTCLPTAADLAYLWRTGTALLERTATRNRMRGG